ncbi:hypothetical protein OEA41_004170 [Lepraria neglecta]|uniref:Uncharacterized protein n=1 Tax=Lepraria neglecta TaxID=209136 RepID=A0AAD9Z5L6_9LECA|nr:hypothetical protein OEA41_004170 [Lepraria neglecta]
MAESKATNSTIKAEFYKLEDLPDSDDEDENPIPPVENLISATDLITGLLEQNEIQYAVMGGFAVNLLQGQRETRDVDICFSGGFKNLRSILEQQSRLVIPSTKLASGVLKVFVKTGPGQDRCKESHKIEVGLIESGVLGSPKDLAEHQRPVTIGTGAGQKRTIKTLDILYLLRSKMGAFRQRESQSDRTDILHILGTYEGEARASRGKLDREAVEFFVDSIPEEDRSFFKTLLGI